MIESTQERPTAGMPMSVSNLWNQYMTCVMSHSTGVSSLYSHPQNPLSKRKLSDISGRSLLLVVRQWGQPRLFVRA